MQPETEAVKEISRELRIQAMNAIDPKPVRTLQDEMVKRKYDRWENRVSDYKGWLKHGQSVTIKDLIYGSNYTITEGMYNNTTGYNDGYSVAVDVTQGADSNHYDNQNTVNGKLEETATAAYTNHKDAITPTGISLQSGVAFFGFALAMGMMVLLFVGKRKEQN